MGTQSHHQPTNNMMAQTGHTRDQPSHNTLPSRRALELCGIEDETECIKQRRTTSVLGLAVGVTVVSYGCSRMCAGRSSSVASAQIPSLSKAVREWEAGRERRTLVASNPRRSGVVSAYFQQELSSLSEQGAAQD